MRGQYKISIRIYTCTIVYIIRLDVPRSDGIKEELGWLKVIFGVLVAIDASLVAWVGQSFGGPNRILVGVAILAVGVVPTGVVWVNRLAYRRIKELEQL